MRYSVVAHPHKQLPAGLLPGLSNVGFQGHPFRVCTDSDSRLNGRHSRLTSCPCELGATVSPRYYLKLGNCTTHPKPHNCLTAYKMHVRVMQSRAVLGWHKLQPIRFHFRRRPPPRPVVERGPPEYSCRLGCGLCGGLEIPAAKATHIGLRSQYPQGHYCMS